MRLFYISCLSLLSFLSIGQDIANGEFSFQGTIKSYSVYVPSQYDETKPNDLMVGLHPFNTSRWDGASWRDTLIRFAEMNELILLCPDGGPDGRIDDPIDTAFTSFMIDTMSTWYNIDDENIYLMGFSWGGKTTYTYGLQHANRFAGFMPIGAAVSENEVTNIAQESKDKPFYVVHGANDSPNSRFTPLINLLNENDACVNSQLLSGVGHTIDFPNRNAILTEAFQWLKENACNNQSTSTSDLQSIQIDISPNPVSDILNIKGNIQLNEIQILDGSGKLILNRKVNSLSNQIEVTDLQAGHYIVKALYSTGQKTMAFIKS